VRLWLCELLRVDQGSIVGVASNEVAPTQEIVNGRPLMSVEGSALAGQYACFQNADAIVLEQKPMIVWGCA
jgi:hypothetical protein